MQQHFPGRFSGPNSLLTPSHKYQQLITRCTKTFRVIHVKGRARHCLLVHSEFHLSKGLRSTICTRKQMSSASFGSQHSRENTTMFEKEKEKKTQKKQKLKHDERNGVAVVCGSVAIATHGDFGTKVNSCFRSYIKPTAEANGPIFYIHIKT